MTTRETLITDTKENDNEVSDPWVQSDDDVKSLWSELELKYKLLIIITMLILCYIGYSISIILSICLMIILLLITGFFWFSSTNLSVEITVFLSRYFFPPPIEAVVDTKKTKECQWSKAFRANYKIIYAEYLEFEKQYNYRPEMDDVYPNGSITNWDRKWPTVTIRCYGLDTKISKYFPKTMQLINNSDRWLSHVMFSILKPNKFIPRHRGPYRGVFRYQLHLEIPSHKNYEKELYLAVWENTSSSDFWSPANVPNGDPLLLGWKEGDDFLFDDTCVHEVINFTKKRRIILFMDVERHDISFGAKLVHRLFMNAAKYLPAVQQCAKVQDEYLDKYMDKKTNEPKRYQPKLVEDQVDVASMSNTWMWYNTAPEILPYKQARVVINRSKQKKT